MRSILSKLILLIISLSVSELCFRFYFKTTQKENVANLKHFLAKDEYLGWRNNPGAYVPVDLDRRYLQTIRSSGDRVTRSVDKRDGHRLILLGGSIIYGWGVDDKETVAWKLQELLPEYDVRNFAVGAYGTYQSMLLMEQLLKDPLNRGATFIYGFNEHHELRNIGDPGWQSQLARSSYLNTYMPYCESSELKKCKRVSARNFYPELPLKKYSSLVLVTADVYARLSNLYRKGTELEVTRKIFQEMHDIANKNSSRFIVMLARISDEKKKSYVEQFKEYVDCRHDLYEKKQLLARDGSHPHPQTHNYWAECLANYFNR